MQPDLITTLEFLGREFPVAVYLSQGWFVGTTSWLEDNYFCTSQERSMDEMLADLRDQLEFMSDHWLSEQVEN